MADSNWKVSPHQQVKLYSSRYVQTKEWEGLTFKFEDSDGNILEDGAWFNADKMTREQSENAIHRARHIVKVIAGDSAWLDAGSVKELGREKFLRNLADACNKSAGTMFNIKTVFEMSMNGAKRPRLGKTVRFISNIGDAVHLSYSDDERENPRLILNNN